MGAIAALIARLFPQLAARLGGAAVEAGAARAAATGAGAALRSGATAAAEGAAESTTAAATARAVAQARGLETGGWFERFRNGYRNSFLGNAFGKTPKEFLNAAGNVRPNMIGRFGAFAGWFSPVGIPIRMLRGAGRIAVGLGKRLLKIGAWGSAIAAGVYGVYDYFANDRTVGQAVGDTVHEGAVLGGKAIAALPGLAGSAIASAAGTASDAAQTAVTGNTNPSASKTSTPTTTSQEKDFSDPSGGNDHIKLTYDGKDKVTVGFYQNKDGSALYTSDLTGVTPQAFEQMQARINRMDGGDFAAVMRPGYQGIDTFNTLAQDLARQTSSTLVLNSSGSNTRASNASAGTAVSNAPANNQTSTADQKPAEDPNSAENLNRQELAQLQRSHPASGMAAAVPSPSTRNPNSRGWAGSDYNHLNPVATGIGQVGQTLGQAVGTIVSAPFAIAGGAVQGIGNGLSAMGRMPYRTQLATTTAMPADPAPAHPVYYDQRASYDHNFGPAPNGGNG